MRVKRCPSFLCLGGDDGATGYGGSPCSMGIATGMVVCCFSIMAVATATDDAINQRNRPIQASTTHSKSAFRQRYKKALKICS